LLASSLSSSIRICSFLRAVISFAPLIVLDHQQRSQSNRTTLIAGKRRKIIVQL
jgi:hypothetical protein